MARLLSALFFILSFFINGSVCYAQNHAKFTPLAGLPKTGYIFGTLKLPGGTGWDSSAVAFRKEGQIYAVLPDNASERLPVLNISSLGFYNDMVVIGGQESKDLRKAWLIMLYLGEGEPKLVDVVKYSRLDGYEYDFYFNMPPIDAPKDISDLDNDGLPEIEIDFYQRRFRMLMQISASGIHLDHNSPYYAAAFGKLKNNKEPDEYQFREYLLYGVIVGKFSEQDSVNKFLGRNSSEAGTSPHIIADSLKLNKLAKSIGASDLLVAYFTGEMEAAEITKELENKGRESAEFIFSMFNLEKELNLLHLDEVAFNDFIAYFSDTMKEEDFKKSALRSLVSYSGDIFSLLTNYKQMDAALHMTTQMKLQRFELK